MRADKLAQLLLEHREAAGGAGASPVDPYLLRVAEAKNQSLVAR